MRTFNTDPMLSSPRCEAKTRKGTPCKSPAVYGRKRCRMHGGADGSGAPKGNVNALKNGFYTAEAIAERKRIRRALKEMKELLSDLHKTF